MEDHTAGNFAGLAVGSLFEWFYFFWVFLWVLDGLLILIILYRVLLVLWLILFLMKLDWLLFGFLLLFWYVDIIWLTFIFFSSLFVVYFSFSSFFVYFVYFLFGICIIFCNHSYRYSNIRSGTRPEISEINANLSTLLVPAPNFSTVDFKIYL